MMKGKRREGGGGEGLVTRETAAPEQNIATHEPHRMEGGSYKGSKNISIKMLKDVGMIVPKSRETSVVYIYAATQGMRDYIYMQQDRVYYMHQGRG